MHRLAQWGLMKSWLSFLLFVEDFIGASFGFGRFMEISLSMWMVRGGLSMVDCLLEGGDMEVS